MRVAVTGIGLVSPLGHTADEVFAAACAGRSAIRALDLDGGERLASPIAASVHFDADQHFSATQLQMLDRVSQFGVLAAARALADAKIDVAAEDRERAGVFVGTGMGGFGSLDEGFRTLYGEQSNRIRPLTVLGAMYNAPAAWIGIEQGLRGPNLTFSTACSSSAVAIGEAWLRVRHGELEFAIAGGSEAPLTLGSLMAWGAMRTMAAVDEGDPSSSCKPFAKNRSGLVLGEGAAMVILEPWDRAVARGASIHGELIGYGLTTDSSHIARPSVEGQAAALRAALRSAGIEPSRIDAINAHGTGTLANDGVETAAIKTVFGERATRIPISATKAIHGHLLGAAGALEFVLSLLSIEHGVALPTMHLRIPDPQCDLDYVANGAREGVAIRTMLSNSFAFGGTNAVLAIGAAS